MKLKVNIFNETEQKYLPLKKMKVIAENCIRVENKNFSIINIILLSDQEIKDLNNKYLNHNYETDVITFNYDDENNLGEIYISIDTAKLQANEYKVSLTNELLRLVAHGCLHLCGYEDSTEAEKEIIHKKENELISRMKLSKVN